MKRPYQKLIVWQEAHKLCLGIYRMAKDLPNEERFRLVDQVCRAASSVPTNIAEGAGRFTKDDQARFYGMAKASLEEVHYHCTLAKDLGYISMETFTALDSHIQRVSYLLVNLRKRVKYPTS